MKNPGFSGILRHDIRTYCSICKQNDNDSNQFQLLSTSLTEVHANMKCFSTC